MPNAAQRALALLEGRLGDDLLLVTKNIDDLHERAGSTRVLLMHGELLSALCRGCQGRFRWAGELSDFPPCPSCGATELRPDAVFDESRHGLAGDLVPVWVDELVR